jgi:Pilus assembly protein, PilO
MNTLPATHALRVALARAHQRLGTPGAMGCVLIVVALVMGAFAWRGHQTALAEVVRAPGDNAVAGRAASPAAMPFVPRVLPDVAEVPRLLSRIERAATAAGLGWPRADYRVNTATDDTPASVEVRCTLKGPYPAVRRFVTALLQDTPTLTLKEFALSRAAADAADVEAKFAIVVYVAGNASPMSPGRP